MSRASDLGVKPAHIRRSTASRISKAKAALTEIIGLWGDIDQGMVNEAENLITAMDGLTESLDASIELLREEWPE